MDTVNLSVRCVPGLLVANACDDSQYVVCTHPTYAAWLVVATRHQLFNRYEKLTVGVTRSGYIGGKLVSQYRGSI